MKGIEGVGTACGREEWLSMVGQENPHIITKGFSLDESYYTGFSGFFSSGLHGLKGHIEERLANGLSCRQTEAPEEGAPSRERTNPERDVQELLTQIQAFTDELNSQARVAEQAQAHVDPDRVAALLR